MNLIVSTTKWTCKFLANKVLGRDTKFRIVLTDRNERSIPPSGRGKRIPISRVLK